MKTLVPVTSSPVARCAAALSAIVIWALLPAPAAWSSEAPAGMQRQRIEGERLYEAKPSLPEAEMTVEAAPAPVGDAADAPRVRIIRLEATRSRLLDDDAVAAALAVESGSLMTLAELQAVVARVDALYAARGLHAARAVLPAQTIEDGIVRVELVEATLGRLLVEAENEPAQALRPEHVRAFVPLADDEVIDTNALGRSLRLYNLVHRSRIRATLKPGEETGTSDVLLRVQAPERLSLRLQLDNEGRSTVGQERLTTLVEFDNPTGRGDSLALGATLADGTRAGYLAYDAPLDSEGLVFSTTLARDAIRLSGGAIDDLRVDGTASSASVGVRRHWLLGSATVLTTRVDYAHSRSETDVEDLRIRADRIDSLRLNSQFLHYDQHGYWLVTPRLTGGRDRKDASARFWTLGMTVLRSRELAGGLELVAGLDWQATSERRIPAVEEFRVGGTGSVRGYQPGDLAGAEGYRVGAEIRKDGVFAFFEHGGVRQLLHDSTADRGEAYLSSLGFGWRGSLAADTVQVEVTAAQPLTLRERLGRKGQLLLRLQFRPF